MRQAGVLLVRLNCLYGWVGNVWERVDRPSNEADASGWQADRSGNALNVADGHKTLVSVGGVEP